MTELGASDFEAVCADPAVGERLRALEEERQKAFRQFALFGAAGFVGAAIAAFLVYEAGWEKSAFLAFAAIFAGAMVVAFLPLTAAKEGFKHPVLEQLGRRSGFDYAADGFDPPAFETACDFLFGGFGFSTETYRDLFNGRDGEGFGLAVYEACLRRRVGKNTHEIFSGQIYALQRRPGASGETVIVPDRSLLNFWTPAGHMERVPIEGDPDFEHRFEVYSSDPMAALELLDPGFRARLLALREEGRVWVYAGPAEALVAVSGGEDRFEPGSMLHYRPVEDRLRNMFDDVRASMALLSELKAKLG